MKVDFEPFFGFNGGSYPPSKADFPCILNGGGTLGPGTIKFGIRVSNFRGLIILQAFWTYFCSAIFFIFF